MKRVDVDFLPNTIFANSSLSIEASHETRNFYAKFDRFAIFFFLPFSAASPFLEVAAFPIASPERMESESSSCSIAQSDGNIRIVLFLSKEIVLLKLPKSKNFFAFRQLNLKEEDEAETERERETAVRSYTGELDRRLSFGRRVLTSPSSSTLRSPFGRRRDSLGSAQRTQVRGKNPAATRTYVRTRLLRLGLQVVRDVDPKYDYRDRIRRLTICILLHKTF